MAEGGEASTTKDDGAAATASVKRESLNGRWIVDKSRSHLMSDYLRVMDVPDMAIQAHEKGEQETDTFHTISIDGDTVKIIKRSRVNDDVVLLLEMGKEKTEMLRAWSTDRSIKNPEQRPKKAIATSDDPGKHLKVETKLLTVNGMAHVIDTRRLVEEPVEGDEGATRNVIVQEIVITNEVTGATNTTTRYFLPYEGILEGEEESPVYGNGKAAGDDGDGDDLDGDKDNMDD